MKFIKILLLLLFTTIGNSFGAIVHFTPNTTLDASSMTNFVTYNIMGGTLDLSHWGFMASGFQIDNFAATATYGHGTPAVGPPGVVLTELSLNDPITAALPYANAANATSYYSTNFGSPSVIANNQSTYFGFRTVVGANTYYGWMKITRQSSDIVIVDEYAYENVSNTPINAGATGTTGPVLVTSIAVAGQGNVSTITTNNGTLQMVETVLPANATNSAVTWSVQNGTGSATISAAGLLTAVTNGTVTVTATANDGSNVTGSTVITISNQAVLVTSITVIGQGNVSTITTFAGSLQMLANVLPTNATNSTVTWSVQNGTGSATINAAGLLTAVSDGTVTVTATANDGSNVIGNTVITLSNQTLLVNAITVTGQGNATTITTANGTLPMLANVLPTNATNSTVTWSVQNGTGTATISATGLLMAQTNGTVTVIATANDASNVTGSIIITLSNQPILVNSIAVSGQGNATTITTVSGTLQMLANVLPANATNSAVTWSVSPGTGTATISVTGLLTAQTNGTVIVTATANDGSNVTGNMTVTLSNQPIPVNSISVIGQGNATTITAVNGSLQMLATVLPANATNSTVTWSVQNGTGSATISATGLLTAGVNGTVTVTATANDGSNVSGSAVITIFNQPVFVTSITVNGQGNATSVGPNLNLQMIANVLPINATNSNVAWSVQNGTGTATISTTGLLTGQNLGMVTVTATSMDGTNVSGSTQISVSSQPILVNMVSIYSQGWTSTMFENSTLQMYYTVLPGNATDTTITWSIQNGSGSATISASGLISAQNNGTITVTATANDGSNQSGSTVITIVKQVQEPTNLNDILLEKISISPNPLRNGVLNILGDITQKLRVEIVSSTGLMITRFNIQPAERTLDLSNLSSGLYFAVFRTESGEQRLVKFMK